MFVGLDVVWITLVAGPMFKTVLGDMLRPTPDLVAGLAAWVCIVAAVQRFSGCVHARSSFSAFSQVSVSAACSMLHGMQCVSEGTGAHDGDSCHMPAFCPCISMSIE